MLLKQYVLPQEAVSASEAVRASARSSLGPPRSSLLAPRPRVTRHLAPSVFRPPQPIPASPVSVKRSRRTGGGGDGRGIVRHRTAGAHCRSPGHGAERVLLRQQCRSWAVCGTDGHRVRSEDLGLRQAPLFHEFFRLFFFFFSSHFSSHFFCLLSAPPSAARGEGGVPATRRRRSSLGAGPGWRGGASASSARHLGSPSISNFFFFFSNFFPPRTPCEEDDEGEEDSRRGPREFRKNFAPLPPGGGLRVTLTSLAGPPPSRLPPPPPPPPPRATPHSPPPRHEAEVVPSREFQR